MRYYQKALEAGDFEQCMSLLTNLHREKIKEDALFEDIRRVRFSKRKFRALLEEKNPAASASSSSS